MEGVLGGNTVWGFGEGGELSSNDIKKLATACRNFHFFSSDNREEACVESN